MAQGNISASDNYFSKTSKLIPGEAIALFVLLANLAERYGTLGNQRQDFVLAMAVIVGVAAVPYILYQQGVRGAFHYGLVMAAFALWVMSVQGDKLPPIPDVPVSQVSLWVSALTVLFTFFAPAMIPSSELKTPNARSDEPTATPGQTSA